MKKIITIIVSAIIFISLVGCSKTAKIPIEDYKWEMSTIQSIEENGNVIAYNPYADNTDIEFTFPNALSLEMTCYAVNGKITITNETNNSVYYGTYKLTENSPESAIYEITILEEKGTAVTAVTTYQNGTECATLIISLGGYTLNFQVENKENDTEIGVVFQITEPLENAIKKQTFQSKDELLIYINDNFSGCKYFYVFEDRDKSEPISNLAFDEENTYSYYTNIEIPEDCWLIAHKIYKTHENTYCIKASLPMTMNTQSSIDFSFGEKWVYTVNADVAPTND